MVKKLFGGFKRQSFVTGALTLAGAGILCRIIGVGFRIPFANIVGNYGMGLYQMVFPLYALLLILSSAGIPIAISKMVARSKSSSELLTSPAEEKSTAADDKELASTEKRRSLFLSSASDSNSLDASNKFHSPQKILLNALVLLGFIGLIVSGLFLGFAPLIARLQGNAQITKIYLAIAPAVFLVCLISAFRGYFQGLGNMIPTAISQVIEQTVKVSIAITAAILLYPVSIYWSVFGAIAAITISEIVGLLTLIIIYLVHRKRSKRRENLVFEVVTSSQSEHRDTGNNVVAEQPDKREQQASADEKTKFSRRLSFTLMWEILKKSLPITAMASIFPLILVFDSILVINMLEAGGSSTTVATQLYGISSGTVHTLINMPAILGIAIGTAVVPMTARLLKQDRKDEVREKFGLAVKMIFVIAVFFALFYIVFGREIITLLYSRAFKDNPQQLRIASNLLKIESAMILLMGLSQVFTAMLQGAGKAKYPLIALAIGGAAKVIFGLVFIRTSMGIYAVSIGNVLCFAIAFILNAIFAIRFLKIRPRFRFRWSSFKLPVLIALHIGVLIGLVFLLPGGKWWIVLGGGVAFLLYIGAVLCLRIFPIGKNLFKTKQKGVMQ